MSREYVLILENALLHRGISHVPPVYHPWSQDWRARRKVPCGEASMSGERPRMIVADREVISVIAQPCARCYPDG